MSYSGDDLKRREPSTLEALLGYALALAFLGLLWGTVWFVSSMMESASYNALTGANTTTWEAMWVELRVQEGTSANRSSK